MTLTPEYLEVLIEAGVRPLPHTPFVGEKEWLTGQIQFHQGQIIMMHQDRVKTEGEVTAATKALEAFDTGTEQRGYDQIGASLRSDILEAHGQLDQATSTFQTTRTELNAAKARGDNLQSWGEALNAANTEVREAREKLTRLEKQLNRYMHSGVTPTGEDLREPLKKNLSDLTQAKQHIDREIGLAKRKIERIQKWISSLDSHPNGVEANDAFIDFIVAGIKLSSLMSAKERSEFKLAERLMELERVLPILVEHHEYVQDIEAQDDCCGRGCC